MALGRFDANLNYKAPEALRHAIAAAAARRCLSASAYVREAIVTRLHSEGIDFAGAVQPEGDGVHGSR